MDNIATDSAFTADEQRTLLAVAAAAIPPSTEYALPGADDPAIRADIVATAGRYSEAVAAGLALAEKLAQAKHSAAFADLAAEERLALVTGIGEPGLPAGAKLPPDAAGVAGHRTLLRIVVQCYYRDDRVMRSLEMEPRPPFPKGFEVEQGDWSLLDPVKQRGRIYREVG